MGGFASTYRGHAVKDGAKTTRESGAPQAGCPPAGEDVKMDEPMDVAECLDSVGEAKLGSLRVKDPDAWKGTGSPRPRSALKHAGGTASQADSEGSGGLVERTPSGRRMPRKVSFQVCGLSAPEAVSGQGGEGLNSDGSPQAHKRVRGSEEFSMKFLVEKFYNRVLGIPKLQPFFDGVDMLKLKNQQEALMLLVFGGQELLEDELPGLSADLRLIHLHLLFEGLNLTHWQMFADAFGETLDELPQIPDDIKQRAKAYMSTTQHYFRPIESDEWPPKVVYKGWTKRSCPFHTSFKRPDEVLTLPPEGATTTHPAAAGAATSAEADKEDDDSDFVLPGINSPAFGTAPRAAAPAAEDAAELKM